MSDLDQLVVQLKGYAELPFEGGDIDPLIEVMNGLAAQAAGAIEALVDERNELRNVAESAGNQLSDAAKRIAALEALVVELAKACKETRSDLFYQISSHHSPKVASGYPSVIQADAALSSTLLAELRAKVDVRTDDDPAADLMAWDDDRDGEIGR